MISRRRMAAFLAAVPVVAQAPPSPTTPKAPPSDTPEGKLQKAKDGVRAMSERLSKLEVPMDVEPAFAFKP